MKVVLVNTSDSKGGAAVACRRLHLALKSNGIDCILLVLHKTINDEDILEIPYGRVAKKIRLLLFYIELFLQKIFKKKFIDFSFSLFGIKLSKYTVVNDADIVHLHWIHNSFVDISDLNNLISSGKKVFWTMHDMWAFTGGCHYNNGCEKYLTSCNYCPQLRINIVEDIANNQFQKKLNLHRDKINYITPSVWLSKIAKNSSLLNKSNVTAIPNTIDTNLYTPLTKLESLELLNINLDVNEKIFLFIAMNAHDPRKGFDLLVESLNQWVSEKKIKITLLIVGRAENMEQHFNPTYINIICTGRIFDLKKISAAYSCADAFLIPSKQDNLPNTIMESLTFGTPIVANNVGGIPEMIEHGKTGYLANNSNEFKNGIDWAFNLVDYNRNLCRQFALENYTSSIIAKKHLSLYEKSIFTDNTINNSN